MKNAIYSPETYGPNEEAFTAGMKNVLQMAPPSRFGTLVASRAPHLGHPISEVTHMVADFGEAERMRAPKEIRSATQRMNLKGPMKVMRIQTG